MSMTVPVLTKIETNSDVSAISSGKSICFAQRDGRLVIDEIEIKLPPITSLFQTNYGDVIVGTRDGLYTFRDGKEIRFSEFMSGIDSIQGVGDYCVAIDGLAKAHIIDAAGVIIELPVSSVSMASIGKEIALATDSGEVSTFSINGEKIWSRPMRGEVGERITAIGWNGEILVVAREGHGLVPGEEEALEVEYWRIIN